MEQNKHSMASKKRWENISLEDRKIRMSELAKKRWNSTPMDQRITHAKMMRSHVGKKVA